MIPKIIHYVWVGPNPETLLVKNCIESWKKWCPDYKIVKWGNESLIGLKNTYVEEAVECRKWAFVSDYLRLKALKEQGGFYFDSDLLLTNSIDEFRKYKFVTGYENYHGSIAPFTALLGAEKNNSIINDLFKEYDDIKFIVNGKMDTTTNVYRMQLYLNSNYGLKPENYDESSTFWIDDQSPIFPSHFFCTPIEGKENYSIHLFNGSWLDSFTRREVLKFGPFKVVGFRKFSEQNKSYPLFQGEKVVIDLPYPNKKRLCLIWKKKK